MFSHFIREASLERMVKTGGKSDYSPLSGKIYGHLKPLGDTQDFVGLDQMSNLYSFTCSSIENIKEGDRITIDGTKYNVRGVKDHIGIRVSFTKAIIVENKG